MPRSARARAESGFYHVIQKGNGGQTLFEDAQDYRAYLDFLSNKSADNGISVLAYCLMSNHVHLLLRDSDGRLSEMMHALTTSYAQHFNKRGGHIGHVFQQRFKSRAIEDDGYLLQALRYIHNNPAKAGVCPAPEYYWSSYREYVGTPVVADTAMILELCGGPDGFAAFSAAADDGPAAYSFGGRERMTDAHAASLAAEILDPLPVSELKSADKPLRNALLWDMRRAGISVRQIARMTGIGKNIIERAR